VGGRDRIRVDLRAAAARRDLATLEGVSKGTGYLQLPRVEGTHWNSSVVCVEGRYTVAGVETRGRGEDSEDWVLLVRSRPNVLK
jgi:hypothetical protein